jgi:hypothetical protein
MITRASRFNAASRLKRRVWWKNAALALLSAYVLALSILPKFLAEPTQQPNFDLLGFAPIVASALILVFSLLVAFDEDQVRQRYLYDNGKRLSDLYHRYKLAINEGKADSDFTALTRRQYEKAMNRCPYNHDDLDYDKAILHDLGGKARFTEKVSLAVRQFIDVYLWPLIAVAVPPAIAAPALWNWAA